jgi:hypothetical protein
MGATFTVIQFQRQHFGNEPGSFDDVEPDVPFVGAAKEFVFDCPHVDPNEAACLLFQSRDVGHRRNILQVNGIEVFGGLPVSPARDSWNGNVLLVERHHQLREAGNVLRIEARNTNGGTTGDIDDFIIDNVVIQYKTADGRLHGVFNVRSYGAKGRNDANDDDLGGILRARDALDAAGGSILFFPQGTYVVNGTIELGPNTTVLGVGTGSVLLTDPNPAVPRFNMLRVRGAGSVRVRDLVLDGNRTATTEPVGPDNENTACGIFGTTGDQGQSFLSIANVIIRNHHRAGVRVLGPANSDDVYDLNPNEVDVIGCRIHDCGSRGVILTRATRAQIAGNVVSHCTQAGIQLILSRAAVIDGNVIEDTRQRPDTRGGHGIGVANSFDYAIVNNVAIRNTRWGIVASGFAGASPPMSQRYVVANNFCRANTDGGITLDPSTADADGNPTGIIHASFATVACNVCTANTGAGIHTIHAGYVTVQGNICDGRRVTGEVGDSAGISIVASRNAVVADNVLVANRYGVAFFGNPDESPNLGEHLVGGNVYDRNQEEIHIGEHHPPVGQVHERPPSEQWGGITLPVKPSPGDPQHGVDGALYLNTNERRLNVYADGAWRTLQTATGPSW